MDNFQITYDASVIKPVKEIHFSILGNDEIKRMSALAGTYGIEIPDLYDKQEPRRGGLIDPRMGGSGTTVCATCQLDNKYCDGHSAHIDLAEPVFHPLYLQYIKQILNCICIGCSNLLINKENKKVQEILQIKSKKLRFKKIQEIASKAKYCGRSQQNCGMPVSSIKLDIKKRTSAINIYSEIDVIDVNESGVQHKKKNRLNLTPDIISDIFDNISDEDCRIMGLDPIHSRPSNMIHKIFIVPPVHVRPSLRGFFTSGTSEDSLTVKLAEIIKNNTRINKQKETNNENSSKYLKDHAHLLQYHVAWYYDPDLISIPKNDAKSSNYKPLRDRFEGKTGRIRGNIMGKRCNFNARTVITSDPTISANHLGVPVKIAMNITFPEIVTPYNYEALKQAVKNGTDIYPGANFVFRGSSIESGKPIHPIYLKFKKDKINLQYGDIVERHIVTGDIVLLNRQPTLHKQSMMGHKIKVIDDNSLMTFRLSVAVTEPYNADFDGDEMNIFIPQSIQTRIELDEIANVKRQLITPTNSVCVIGIKQDGLIGAYNLTDSNTILNWRDAMNIISYTNIENISNIDKKDISGSELFSMLIPNNISLNNGKNIVKNGQLIKGQLTKTIIGAMKKDNLIQYIWDENGDDTAINFIDNIQKLTNNFILLDGFTVGIGDAKIDNKTKDSIRAYIKNVTNKIDLDITNIENNPNYMDVATFEGKIFKELNVIRDEVSATAQDSIDRTNNFNIMLASGSKGKVNNIGQITGCVGFQPYEGSMQRKIYANRTLCYFHENDDRPNSRGLCYNSYMDGLTYTEFCYHTATGRAAKAVGQVKTADSGYIQRKLAKTMEDIMIKYDGTVRIANNQIIQTTYGGNNCDTSRQYSYKFRMIEMDNKTLESVFKFTQSELKNYPDFKSIDNDRLFNQLIFMRNSIRYNYTKALTNYIIINSEYMVPLNLKRVINAEIDKQTKLKNDLTPTYIIQQLENLLHIKNTPLIRIPESQQDNPPEYAIRDDQIAKTTFRAALYEILNPKIVLLEHKMSKNTFDATLKEIKRVFNNNIIEPGEMVGMIAAQSLGSAVTQMTLDAFHSVGVASLAHSTVGVPRITELLSVTKNPKTPQMFVYMTDDNKESRTMAYKCGSYIQNTTIGSIRNKIDVYYDPSPTDKKGLMKQDCITEPFYTKKISHNSCQADINNLPWLFRIEIDKEKMLEHEITLLDIKSKFCIWWERRYVHMKKKKEKIATLKKITSFAMLSNTDNDRVPVIHIRFNVKDLDNTDTIKSLRNNLKFNKQTLINFIDIIDNFRLKGLENVSKVHTIEPTRYMETNDGNNMHKGEEYVIYTSGVNLNDLRYLSGIDIYRSYSDDIQTMYNTFGIEFARPALICELSKAFANAGNTSNPQHISILVDLICQDGILLPVTRDGMKKRKLDPLAKASFERAVDTLLTASVYTETDRMQSVSSRLFIGSVIKGGTGYCELILDTDKIQNSEYIEEDITDSKHNIVSNTLANAIMDNEGGEDIFIPE
jgi:DNA-directed RNA polymerase II subunit RPB1